MFIGAIWLHEIKILFAHRTINWPFSWKEMLCLKISHIACILKEAKKGHKGYRHAIVEKHNKIQRSIKLPCLFICLVELCFRRLLELLESWAFISQPLLKCNFKLICVSHLQHIHHVWNTFNQAHTVPYLIKAAQKPIITLSNHKCQLQFYVLIDDAYFVFF